MPRPTMVDYVHETPSVIRSQIENNVAQPLVDAFAEGSFSRVRIVACGSSRNASLIARPYLRRALGREVIITESLFSAEEFQKRVDSAAVYVNCSTRFTDGEEFGLGAEIGISTQKLHTRGPMGLKELTTVKYLINGSGQIRE